VLAGALRHRPAAAGADERAGALPVDLDHPRLEVGLVAAVGADAVHAR